MNLAPDEECEKEMTTSNQGQARWRVESDHISTEKEPLAIRV